MIEEGTGPVSYTCYGQEEGSSLKSAESNSSTTQLLRKFISTLVLTVHLLHIRPGANFEIHICFIDIMQ